MLLLLCYNVTILQCYYVTITMLQCYFYYVTMLLLLCYNVTICYIVSLLFTEEICPYTGDSCIDDCDGRPYGKYQSCVSCREYYICDGVNKEPQTFICPIALPVSLLPTPPPLQLLLILFLSFISYFLTIFLPRSLFFL